MRAAKDKKYIVTEKSLLQLLEVCPACCGKCVVEEEETKGTYVAMNRVNIKLLECTVLLLVLK